MLQVKGRETESERFREDRFLVGFPTKAVTYFGEKVEGEK